MKHYWFQHGVVRTCMMTYLQVFRVTLSILLVSCNFRFFITAIASITSSSSVVIDAGKILEPQFAYSSIVNWTEIEDIAKIQCLEQARTATRSASKYANYTLVLTSSTPAILDSRVQFYAALHDCNGHVVLLKTFLYVWRDTVHPRYPEITYDHMTSNISKIYRSPAKPTNYSMDLIVYDKKSEFVANRKTTFILTENLNGNLVPLQKLSFHRNHSCWAARQPLSLDAALHDRLNLEDAEYRWQLNGTEIARTHEPWLNSTFYVTGESKLKVDVTGMVYIHIFKVLKKHGTFEQTVTFLDPLTMIWMSGGAMVPINKMFNLTVSCNGGGSTSVCWSLQPLDGVSNETVVCTPTPFIDGCTHILNITLPSSGRYRFNAQVLNDVSTMRGVLYVYAYDPGDSTSNSVVLPLVFVAIALVIVSAGVAYIVRLRTRKTTVEVADFDFHPSISQSSSAQYLPHRLKVAIRGIISHQKKYKDPWGIAYRPAANRYGTFREYSDHEEL